MDPNTDPQNALPAEDNGQAAAAALAAADAASNDQPTAPEAADAFTQGVEAAREVEEGEDLPTPPAPGTAPDPAAEGGDVPAPAADGKPEGEGEPGKDGKPEGAPAAPDAPPGEQPDPVDAEMKDLGITNERTQKRFRELTERAAEVEQLRPMAERYQQWEETIRETRANPQQMGQALNYLAAVNSGDPNALNQAYEFMQQEMTWLAQKLGRAAPGYDPLTEHPDLAQQVQAGEVTRAAAEELARSRRAQALQQESHTRQLTEAQQAAQAQQLEQQAMQQVAELGQQLRTTDPAFEAKFRALQPTVAFIQRTLPPNQWAAAIREAYRAIPAHVAQPAPPPATPAAVAPPRNPARPSGANLAAAPTKENAFDFGVQLAREQGR